MKTEMIIRNNVRIAVVNSSEVIISDVQSALDFIMTVCYEAECACVAVNREAFSPDFFRLSTGLAGEILQKFANYEVKLAIFGDFSRYTSKPLHDFMYESNHGNNVFFQPDMERAVEKLSIFPAAF